MNNTTGPEWGKTLIKVKTQNDAPKGFNFVGLNLTKELFKDVKVRRALAHLMNRDLMIEKFHYGMVEKTKAPGLLSEYQSSNLKAIEFDSKKALALLKEAGWADSDSNGVLDKVLGGKKTDLAFDVMIATETWNRFMTVFKEDAKKVGVDIRIKQVEWNTFQKLLDEKRYDSFVMAWGGGGTQWDPKQIWHSTSDKGSNYVSYSNPEVDKIIDEARNTWDRSKRASMLKKVNEFIAADVPYIFLFNPKYTLYAHGSKIKKPKDTFRYGIGSSFWWEQK
jgi:peptide/nickel transport system substrate-binding protein/microcin C transport system substrate-binding protein